MGHPFVVQKRREKVKLSAKKTGIAPGDDAFLDPPSSPSFCAKLHFAASAIVGAARLPSLSPQFGPHSLLCVVELA